MLAALAILPLGLGGCSVVGSAPTPTVDSFAQGDDIMPQCSSTLGSYSLPKHVFRFIVTKKAGDNFHVLKTIEHKPIPDNNHVFCLDHLRSAFADDVVKVFKSKVTTPAPAQGAPATAASTVHTPYLQLIASKAVDQTAAIIRRFVKAAFILLTNNGSFTTGRSSIGTEDSGAVTVADFQVDPFDYREMARLNFTMRPLGFCFVLEDYTFDAAASATAAHAYCSAPMAYARRHPPQSARVISEMRYLKRKPVSGIFFRPRGSYRLTVYVKPDPDGPGAWRAGLIKNYEFENIMPIVSVGVDRAIFATRRTGLIFDDGMLQNVCISKGSELQGFVQIPIEIIYGVIAAPGEAFRAAVESSTNERTLIEKRQELVDAQNAYIRYLRREDEDRSKITASGTQTPFSLGATGNQDIRAGAPASESPDAGDITGSTVNGAPNVLNDICADMVRAGTGTF